MRRVLLWLILAAILLVSFALYRSQPRDRLNVTPDAAREIERAKHR
jgi:hypothetical protein